MDTASDLARGERPVAASIPWRKFVVGLEHILSIRQGIESDSVSSNGGRSEGVAEPNKPGCRLPHLLERPASDGVPERRFLRHVHALAQQVFGWAGFDRAVAYGVLTRFWSLATGPVLLLLIASHFSGELQGYYYTFRNLLAFQVFVELGLGQVILQFASHEWSKLRLNEQGEIVGDPQALSRLVSLGRFAFQWYAIAAVIIAVGLGVGGFIFFSASPQIGIRWAVPWLVLCILSGIDLFGLAFWSLLQGCGQVTQVYAFHLIQGIVRSLFAGTAILAGAGLWTAPAECFAGLAWAGIFIGARYRGFLRAFQTSRTGPSVNWKTEMLPFQWRIAMSWLSGYFIFSLFTPVLFKLRGSVAAGQMGMTWSLVGALATVSAVWVLSKAPQFGVLVAQKEYAALDRLAWRSGTAAFGVALAGAVALEAVIWFLNARHFSLATRLLPPLPTGLFLLATVLMQISTPQSVYLRAHKREPFLILSVAAGLLTALSTVVLGSRYGATGMAAGYLAVVGLVVLPFGTIICRRCRAEWHAPSIGDLTASKTSEPAAPQGPARNAPSLSVVIPNYNHAQYLRGALEAILTQSLRPVEVIVVDDGSTDNSVEVAEEYVRRDSLVHLLRNEKNRGVIFSINRGLKEASGDFVMFAAADDQVLPELFVKSARLLAQYPHAGLCSAVAVFADEDGRESHLIPPRPWISRKACYLRPDQVLSGWRRYGWLFVSNTAFYRREALLEAGGFPEELRSAADCYVLMNLALRHGACFIPKPLGIFRIRSKSFSSEFQSPEVALDIWQRWQDLIGAPHGAPLPKKYVEECAKHAGYSIALTAHAGLCLQRKECLRYLEGALARGNAADRIFLSALRLAMAAEQWFVRLYLFVRLRHLSWPLVRRKLESLRYGRSSARTPASRTRPLAALKPKTQVPSSDYDE